MFVAKKSFKTLRLLTAICMLAVTAGSVGCTTILSPIEGIPAAQLPEELLGVRRSEFVDVPVAMLGYPIEEPYRLDSGDILGVYIDGVLPYSAPATVPAPPPVQFPTGSADLPPSIGYPIPVQEGGTINLPLLQPFSVRGMSVDEARSEIARRYNAAQLLRSEETVPIVSLMRKRQYTVTVIRSNAGAAIGNDGTAAGYVLPLEAGRNHVLAALTASGGLPGFNEKNEVIVYKTSLMPEDVRQNLMMYLNTPGCDRSPDHLVAMTLPKSNCQSGCFAANDGLIENPWVIRIPLRVPPGTVPNFDADDVVLHSGDIVQVESRDTEFFYTGGLLGGGQFPLPRDYDLDVLGALALAGQGVASQQGGGGGGGMGGGLIRGLGGTSPTQLYIIRRLPCVRTFNIAVDLLLAMNDSRQNILVQPGDTLVLRYKPHEELANFGIGTFFTFGIRELFQND